MGIFRKEVLEVPLGMLKKRCTGFQGQNSHAPCFFFIFNMEMSLNSKPLPEGLETTICIHGRHNWKAKAVGSDVERNRNRPRN